MNQKTNVKSSTNNVRQVVIPRDDVFMYTFGNTSKSFSIHQRKKKKIGGGIKSSKIHT